MTANNNIFRISPLIRLTLISFYGALTVPLPFLAQLNNVPIPTYLFWLAIACGFLILWFFGSEQVVLNEEGISVTYPHQWITGFFRLGWSLKWSQIASLKLRTTGQGGIVYYFVTHSQEKAYLLPMRVAGFSRLVNQVEKMTGIETKDIRPLAQPWMYLILLLFTLFLWLIDIWVLWTSWTLV